MVLSHTSTRSTGGPPGWFTVRPRAPIPAEAGGAQSRRAPAGSSGPVAVPRPARSVTVGCLVADASQRAHHRPTGDLMNARAITKLASAVAATSLAVLGLAAPARAGQWTGVDPSHDVAAYSCTPGCHWKATPGNASADMVEEQVTYNDEKIKIKV